MTFEQYLSIVARRWMLVLGCCLLVGAGAYVGTKLVRPVYEATALVQVVDTSDSSLYNALLASQQLTQTEVDLATSDSILRTVASRYPGLTPEQLGHEVTAQTELNTPLFEVDVRDAHASRAAALANDIVTTLAGQQVRNRGNAQFSIVTVQSARRPQTPVQPSVKLNTGIGLLAGLLLGLVLVALLGEGDRRLRTASAVKRGIGLPVLATVPYEKPSARTLVPDPAEEGAKPDAGSEEYRSLVAGIDFLGVESPIRSLLVTSFLPGEGKTSVATNLALELARSGKSTLLVDADFRHPAISRLFQVSSTDPGLSNTILSMSTLPASGSTMRYRSATPGAASSESGPAISSLGRIPYVQASGRPDLWVMPSGTEPPNSADVLRSDATERLLRTACDQFDFVIFDGPSLSGGMDADAVASYVDAVLITVDPARATQRHLDEAKSRLQEAGARSLACVIARRSGRSSRIR
jgi:non-specific protein-tyrosine kinase